MTFFKKDDDLKKVHDSHVDKHNHSLWARIMNKEDNKLHSDIIIKGFAWVVMFAISLLALFFMFTDRHNTNKEIIVVNSKNNSYSQNFTPETPRETLNIPHTNDTISNLDQPSKNISPNKNNLPSSSNTSVQNSNQENNTVQNIEGKPASSTADTKQSSLQQEPPQTSTPATQEDTIGALIQEKLGSNYLDTKTKNNIAGADNKPRITETTVWLINIYSGTTEASARQKWQELQKQYPRLFSHVAPYFIKTDVPGKGIYYRVSLGNTQNNKSLPYFVTKSNAIEYCQYLKSNNLSCFVVETTTNVLKKLMKK